jgi:hypothetical protein
MLTSRPRIYVLARKAHEQQTRHKETKSYYSDVRLESPAVNTNTHTSPSP